MATIGKFRKQANGYDGHIETRLWHSTASFVQVEKKGDKSPDFRVMAGRMEIGAAWAKKSESGTSYLSVTIDDPSFPAPINCRLHETADGFDLVWQRA